MLAGIIFPRGFYCPGETWNAKNHSADRQGKGASCVVVVGDEVRLCQKVGQQIVPDKIGDGADDPAAASLPVLHDLAANILRTAVPEPADRHGVG